MALGWRAGAQQGGSARTPLPPKTPSLVKDTWRGRGATQPSATEARVSRFPGLLSRGL